MPAKEVEPRKIIRVPGQDASCPTCGLKVGKPHIHFGTKYMR